jgi:hypothetical protein
LIYLLCSSLPWLAGDDKKLSSAVILERKVDTTIANLCDGIPAAFANLLIYSHTLSFSEDPDYDHLHLLFHDLCAMESHSLDFSLPGDLISHSLAAPLGPPVSNDITAAAAVKAVPLHLTKTPVHKSSHM